MIKFIRFRTSGNKKVKLWARCSNADAERAKLDCIRYYENLEIECDCWVSDN